MISIAENAVFKAQTFIRTNYEVSAVSLREIRRFIILFNFFQSFLRKKNIVNLKILLFLKICKKMKYLKYQLI